MDNKFWGKVKNKTNVDKDTIIELAKKLSNGNMKDEKTLREVIDTLSDEKRKKIIDKIVSDKVPKNVDKMF